MQKKFLNVHVVMAMNVKSVLPYICQAVPGIDPVDLSDVVFSSEDVKETGVGVVELYFRKKKRRKN